MGLPQLRHVPATPGSSEGWSAGSYDIIESFPTFWEWLKSVIEDIADWTTLPGKE